MRSGEIKIEVTGSLDGLANKLDALTATASIHAAVARPGDAVVLTVSEITTEQVHRIGEQWAAAGLDHVKLVILGGFDGQPLVVRHAGEPSSEHVATAEALADILVGQGMKAGRGDA